MIKQKILTSSKTIGKNTCEYIVLHHTAENGSLWGVLNWLSKSGKASAHFVIDFNGDIYQIWEERDILWHCGLSEWGWRKNLNNYSIGIEVRWIATEFTDKQQLSVAKLVKYLAEKYNIPEKNLIRHKDIAPLRKNDIHDNFWNKNFGNWEEYRKSLFIKNNNMENKYIEILKEELKECKEYEPVYKEHDEIKALIEIGFLRYFKKYGNITK